MKRSYVIISLVLAVGIGAAGLAFLRSKKYTTIHPQIGEITEAVYGLGKVKSNKRYEVIVGVMATVSHRFVNEGENVLKNAPLLKFEDQVIFRAPFAGTVTFVRSYVGETAVPHTPILLLEDLNDRYIELSLEQQAALRISPGLPAFISFESLRGKILRGKVKSIFPRQDEFLVQISVDDLDPKVLPGMTADVTIEIGKIQNAVLVPLKALTNGMLSVKKGRKWQKVKVEVGHVDGLLAEIKGETISPADEIQIKAGL